MDELDEARDRFKRKLEANEATYFAHKIGLSIVEHQRIWREAFQFLMDPEGRRLDALNARVCALEESLQKAREAFAELKRQGGQK